MKIEKKDGWIRKTMTMDEFRQEMALEFVFAHTILKQHGWKYDEGNRIMVAPNGKHLRQNEFHRMQQEDFAMKILEAGGTPYGTYPK